MTPEERDLISGVFERLRAAGGAAKDRDADAFIREAMRVQPDAPYLLVQTLIVLEHTLTQTQGRVQELEGRVRELEAREERGQASGGSFLGGLFGGAGSAPAPQRPSGAVPATGPTASPWGRARDGYADAGQPAPGYGGGFAQPAPARSGGGGFLAGALTTAAGVAGGMLAVDAIKGMMGGGHGGSLFGGANTTGHDTASNSTNTPLPGPTQEAHYQSADDNDPGNDTEDYGFDSGDDGSVDA